MRRWLRDTATNLLTGQLTNADTLTAPAGFDYVGDGEIRVLAGADALLGPGDFWDGRTYTPRAGPSMADLVTIRRTALMRLLRGWANVPSLPSMTAREPRRAVAYLRKVQADLRAILVDENLSDGARYVLLETELSQSAERWIWKFHAGDWHSVNGYYEDSITTWAYYSTAGDIHENDTMNNISGTAQPTVGMVQTGVNVEAEIGKFTT